MIRVYTVRTARSTQSFWSETSHLIRMEVMTRKSCLLGEEKDCSGPILREEREVVEEVTNHYEKKGKICAPLNCKFKAPDGNQHCAENNDTVLIQLRTKLCTVCEPKLEENLKSVENCGDISTKDCIGDPLIKPWKKFCTNRKEEKITFANSISKTEVNKKSSETERSNGEPETNTIFDNLFSKSLNPVNSLFQRTLGNHAHSSERKERKLSGSSDDSKRLITGNHIHENGADDVKIKFNFESAIQQNSSENYFPPVLNSRNNLYTKNEEPELEISFEPILTTAPTTRSEVTTKFITKETTTISKLTITTSAPSTTTTLQQSTFTTSTLKYATISTTKTSTPITSADTILSTILPINSRTQTRVAPKTTKAFMAKTAILSTTTPVTTALPTATFSTTSRPALILSSSKPHHKILLSDFLKRCFQDFTDPSCSFSESVHHHRPIVQPQTTARVKEIKITQATTTKSLARKLKEFNSLFQSTTPTTRRRDTTTTTTRSTTAHPINKKAEAIKAKVQAELRAAFFG
eukprot:GFUD01130048.1.p1 GENE.GFUD01130048.1~~GFUD01130048.1.p1  ORF type:complete len:523 (-),score=105.93 GFUD01130048.1:57-1625(-)